HLLLAEPHPPSAEPLVETQRIAEQRAHPSLPCSTDSSFAQPTKRERKVRVIRRHQVQKIPGELLVPRIFREQSQLPAKSHSMRRGEQPGERIECLLRLCHRLIFLVR